MRHLELKPKHQAIDRKSGKKASSLFSVKVLALGFSIVAGMGALLTALWNPLSGDHLSELEQAEIEWEFALKKTTRLEMVDEKEIVTAIKTMNLNSQQQTMLVRQLTDPDNASNHVAQPNKVELAWIELWDFASHDGDIVHLSSAGFEIEVAIEHAPTRIAIPVDGSATISVLGVHDGGGGITLGIRSALVPTMLPLMREGQKILLPVSL